MEKRRVLSALQGQGGRSSHSTARQVKRSKNKRQNLETPRRVVREMTETPAPLPILPEWSPNDEVEGWEIEDHLDMLDEDSDIVSYVVSKSKRYQSSDDPMKEWIPTREAFLQELLRREAQTAQGRAGVCVSCIRKQHAQAGVGKPVANVVGGGPVNGDGASELENEEGSGIGDGEAGTTETAVPSADTSDFGNGEDEEGEAGPKETAAPLYRCQECGGANECESCCLERHRNLPLHIIERWSGTCFQRHTLQAMGLRVQLGHNGMSCPVPESAPKSFTVLHVNGIHTVNLDYCNCDQRILRPYQLLRAGWYPATVKFPATTATMELLKNFHGLSLCSKVSAHEYYLNLERLTNNSRIDIPKTRYRAFLRMVRQWRHLRLLKRAGRGHVEKGIENIEAGELALDCAACPMEGVNLPEDWKTAPAALRFLYVLFVSIDANFRLKNRLRKSEHVDPGLHTGLAYFVSPTPYKNHVLKHATQADMSSCSGFQAMSRADSKSTAGLRYTGVGMCVCSRHEMVRPLGVGDLQKGERYCNMDFIVLSALYGLALIRVMIIYDIACQWKVNFPTRMAELPQDMRLPTSCSVDFAIPKCHAPAHQTKCQTPHSLNLKPGAGRTDGEGIERDWSVINLAANSTKEMGEGSRHDTLDDLFAYHNWQKTTGLGSSLKRKYLLAVVEARRHKGLHEEFCDVVPPQLQAVWTRMITEWESDKEKPNPYVSVTNHETEADVKRKLMSLECKEAVLEGGGEANSETTFLSLGFGIEELQRRLRQDTKKESATSLQATQIQEKRLHLSRQITKFRKSLRVYMPTAYDRVDTPLVDAEHVHLALPSFLKACLPPIPVPSSLTSKEAELRVAQCHDALERIRLTQRAKRSVTAHKKKHTQGQQAGTRVNSEFERLNEKIKQAADKYRCARQALVTLLGEDHVPEDLRELTNNDIVPPPAFDIDPEVPTTIRAAAAHLGEGHRQVPWIWRAPGVLSEDDEDDPALNAGLRIEWSKSRARCLRWSEELLLVKEEMRRVRKTLQHRSSWWSARANADHVPSADASLAQGICAYAHRQSLVNSRLCASFTAMWERPPGKRSRMVGTAMPSIGDAFSAEDETLMTDLLAGTYIDVDDDDDDDDEGGFD